MDDRLRHGVEKAAFEGVAAGGDGGPVADMGGGMGGGCAEGGDGRDVFGARAAAEFLRAASDGGIANTPAEAL